MKRWFIINNSIELIRLYPEDIVCIEADGNYSTFYLVGGEKRLVLLQLGQLESMMGEQLGGEANLNRQQLLMRDTTSHSHETLKVSRESLKKLKELVEVGVQTNEDNEQGTL